MIASLGMQASCQGVNRDRDKVGKGASWQPRLGHGESYVCLDIFQ